MVEPARAVHATSASLDAALAPGERVLWRGKPERRPFIFRTWPLSFFGLVLTAATIVYEWEVLTTPAAPAVLAYWGIPFAIAALYMLAGHFLVTAREWQNTEYVLTDRQVLIRHGVFSPRVDRFSLLGLPHTVIKMLRDDVGNLLFEPRSGQGYGPWPGYQTMWPYTPGYLLGFMFVRDPEGLQRLIESVRTGR